MRAALCVHGAGGGGWEWNIWRRVLVAAGWQLAAPDLKPCAEGIEATRFDDYSAQVADALAQLPRPRVLIGASLGGLLAARHAASADALVLVNPMPPAPWAKQLPARAPYPARIPWRGEASLASTRAAMPDADAAGCLFAFEHWRDESGLVLNAARAGITVDTPKVPTLLLISGRDHDVPAECSRALAIAWQASVLELPGASHVGPLLGRGAAACARQVSEWLIARR